jgi:ribosomal protein S21
MFWTNRREENHIKWEDRNATQAIKMKARHAQEKAIEKENRKKAQRRRQRNNFREY